MMQRVLSPFNQTSGRLRGSRHLKGVGGQHRLLVVATVDGEMSRAVTLPLRLLRAVAVRTQPAPLLPVELLPHAAGRRHDLALVEDAPVGLRSAEPRVAGEGAVTAGQGRRTTRGPHAVVLPVRRAGNRNEKPGRREPDGGEARGYDVAVACGR